MEIELVAIGASWGGLHAVEQVLEALPRAFGAAVVIAQHRRSDADDERLARLLDAHCALDVCDAEDKQSLEPGVVLVAPADYHLHVERADSPEVSHGWVELSVDEPEHFSRPSIDVLFGSAADAYGDRVAGVVLTGANADGARGLAQIARRGGPAIVQEPDTATRREMPEAALAATPDARVAPLEEIGPLLSELVRERARS